MEEADEIRVHNLTLYQEEKLSGLHGENKAISNAVDRVVRAPECTISARMSCLGAIVSSLGSKWKNSRGQMMFNGT